MLEPAVLYSPELAAKFLKEIYSNRFFLYIGAPHRPTLPDFDPKANFYQWAIVDHNSNRVIGYFEYGINQVADTVNNFGVYSFERNPIIGYDVMKKMEELVRTHHRIEWNAIAETPAVRHYDKFCKRHNGRKFHFHDVTKSPEGKFVDVYVYEIVNNN